MKNFKKILSALLMLSLALCLCFSLASCTTPDADGDGDGGDGKVEYTVNVKNEDGAPIPSIKVQLYLDGVVSMGKGDFTDENGKVTFELKEGNYSAKIIGIPSGYNYVFPSDAFPLSDGEVTITLESLIAYTVYVKDASGAAASGVSVQLCDSEGCRMPVSTDSEGKAVFYFEESDFKAALSSDPETKYEFVNNEVTITLPAE